MGCAAFMRSYEEAASHALTVRLHFLLQSLVCFADLPDCPHDLLKRPGNDDAGKADG